MPGRSVVRVDVFHDSLAGDNLCVTYLSHQGTVLVSHPHPISSKTVSRIATRLGNVPGALFYPWVSGLIGWTWRRDHARF